MVGEAFTLRYMPAREDLNPLVVFRDRGHPQRKAVEECPPGAVMVIDSRKDARAASAGGILVSRLKARGVAGVVTDGGFRDSAEIATLGIPAYHQRPSAPTNLTLHQAIEINGPIGCGDAPVFPGDVVVGDADGVIVLPAHLADEIRRGGDRDDRLRGLRHRGGQRGRSILGLYPATDEQTLTDFAAWRKAKGAEGGSHASPDILRRMRSSRPRRRRANMPPGGPMATSIQAAHRSDRHLGHPRHALQFR